MQIETVELTLNHVGLGNLNEQALLALFASAQAHRLTAGTGNTLHDIVDKNNRLLYPAYYMTHLRVPPGRLLESFRLWSRVGIGVDVRSFGGMMLESEYILADADDVPERIEDWEQAGVPTMTGGNMFLIEGQQGEPQVSAPKSGTTAEDLPKLGAPPASMETFRKVRTEGSLDPEFVGGLTTDRDIEYRIEGGRDAAAGHNMMFAKFVEIMDYAEHTLLTGHLRPAFPTALVEHNAVLERENYYFGNCRANQTLSVAIRGKLESCPPGYHGASTAVVSAGILTFFLELYQRGTNTLLAASRVRKLLAVPSSRQSVLRDAERMLHQYGVE